MFCMQSITLGLSATLILDIYAMDQLRKSRRNGRNCIYETEVQGGGMSFKCFHNLVTQKDGLLDDSILTISPH